jgi:hypothetical protein
MRLNIKSWSYASTLANCLATLVLHIIKVSIATLDCELVRTVALQSAHENRELRIAYQDTLYSENNYIELGHIHSAGNIWKKFDLSVPQIHYALLHMLNIS